MVAEQIGNGTRIVHRRNRAEGETGVGLGRSTLVKGLGSTAEPGL